MGREKTVTFRFSVAELEMLARQARDNGMDKSAWVRELMRMYEDAGKVVDGWDGDEGDNNDENK